ncbi:unnamed protein product [Rodentolepis nana]|uniref:Ovule protein n=1 Tax=Rodentolepis nana TaxID=102285 RepID=A0A0R3U0S5_RODNA|nr:unnamed protein product [Rodentolepis nana]
MARSFGMVNVGNVFEKKEEVEVVFCCLIFLHESESKLLVMELFAKWLAFGQLIVVTRLVRLPFLKSDQQCRRPAFFSVPQGVLTPFFQSDQQCCEGRLFFQSDQQCCEGRRASSLISSVAKSVPPSLISSVAKGVPLTLISSVAKGVPLSFSFLKVFGPKHSIVFMCLDQNTR